MQVHNHLSIGEVLALLQDDFPDVTISKIRFLESQGLLNPERTPSGYRKFRAHDIEQLRWILREQRDNFLPLKVIKERLDSGTHICEPDVAIEATVAARPEPEPEPEPIRPRREPAARAASSRPRSTGTHAGRRGGEGSGTSLLDRGQSSVSMSADELSRASGLSPRVIAELERYGLLESNRLGSVTYFDEDALIAARLAAAFLDFGMEPRHLRMYKIAAEREAGVFEQLMLPLLKQRGTAERHEAIRLLEELSALGDQFRAAMLRGALRSHLDRS